MWGRVLSRVRAGTSHGVWLTPALLAPETIAVSSRDFADGQSMARAHAAKRRGNNLSPDLSWSAPPDGTAAWLLILEDADVPFPRPLIHMAAVLRPQVHGVARGDLEPRNPTVRFLRATLGTTGYAGPNPPPGHGLHHYEFSLYALSRRLPAEVRTISAARKAVAGSVLARGRLTGTYER